MINHLTMNSILKDELTAICQRLRADALHNTDDECPLLYHYTSPDALMKILSCGQIWATSIRHFEDASELLYAEEVYATVLDEIKEQHPNSIQSKLAEACSIEKHPGPRRSGPLSPGSGRRTTWLNRVLDIFVTCFSPRDDLLSQWQNYARRGAGFAIGFDRLALEAAVRPLSSPAGSVAPANVYFVKVRYSVPTQKRELRSIFGQCCAVLTSTSSESDISLCADEIVNVLALHASLFKAPRFTDENEWRMIVESLPGRPDLCFRSSAAKLIPYIKTPKQMSGRLPVASIDIGPAMDQEASRGGVQALLDAKGYHGVKISAAHLLLSLSDF